MTVLGVTALVPLLFAAPPPVQAHLERGRALFDTLRYAEAAKVMEEAWATPGLDRPAMLEVLSSRAVLAAVLGQTERARVLFNQLASLEPDYRLGREDLGPHVVNLFYEAKGRASAEGPLRFEVTAVTGSGVVSRVQAVVQHDHHRLARRVRFRLRAAGEQWQTQSQELAEGSGAER